MLNQICYPHAGPKVGRLIPMEATVYTPEKAAAICEHVAEGRSQRKACELVGVLESTFRLWKREHAEIAAHYTRAREERANGWAEEFIDLADEFVPTGDPVADKITLQHIHERLDARKWVTSRILKDYNEKKQLTGEDGGPLQFVLTRPAKT